MAKYYKVLKANFLWEEGAILQHNGQGYSPIEDVWNKIPEVGGEYISTQVVENSPEWFERVYKGNGDKLFYVSAEAFKNLTHYVK